MSEKELNKAAAAGMSAKGMVDDEELRAVSGACTYPECGPGSVYYYDHCYDAEWQAKCTEAFKTGHKVCGQEV